MLTLYYSPNACSLSIHITLYWCDALFNAERVVFGESPLTTLSPLGTVGLIDRGDESGILTQTPAILSYLAERFPAANIDGDNSLNGRAEKNKWLSFLASDVHHVFHLLFRSSRYGIKDNTIANEAVRMLCLERFEIINQRLLLNQWMLGNRKSIVDAYLFPMVCWYYRAFPEKNGQFKAIDHFYEMMCTDEGVKKAIEIETSNTS